MKRIFQLIMVMGLMVLLACSGKDSDLDPIAPPSSQNQRIMCITTTWDNYPDTKIAKYYYDSQNRLVEAVYTRDGFDVAHDRFEYTSDSVTRRSDNGGIIVYTLNSDGLAVASSSNGRPLRTYKYNNDGYMVEQVNPFNEIIVFTYSNGNMVKKEVDQNVALSRDLSYYNDKPNTVGNHNIGITFFGKDSKNLLKHGSHDESLVFNREEFSLRSFMEEHEYSYVFDAEGRAAECNNGSYYSVPPKKVTIVYKED